MGVTLKDLAEMAGVHKSTIDKVIHNRPGVSDKKRAEIKKLLEETGYEANPLAKALNYQKKKLKVAVILLNVDSYNDIRRGMDIVQQDFKTFNIEVEYHVVDVNDSKKQAEILDAIRERNISGVVLQPIESEIVLQAAKAIVDAGIPLVTVNTDMKESGRMCFVGQSTIQSAKTAARMMTLFLEKGNVGIISNDSLVVLLQREFYFRKYMEKIPTDITLLETFLTKETADDAYRVTSEMLDKYPNMDGLFITMGQVPAVCKAVEDKGRLDDLVIVCYERYPEIAHLIDEGKIECSISGRTSEQGRIGMRILFEYMVNDQKPEKDTIFTTNEIYIKENVME